MMNRTCKTTKSYIYQEAINHCRWKSVLRKFLMKTEFHENQIKKFGGKSFEEILLYTYKICSTIKGIGLLTIYDIASAVCRYNNINIDKIYIIGNGPKRAIELLNMKAKTKRIGDINLKYVEISDLLRTFRENNYEMDLYSSNGDDYETFICNWQKGK